jgi:hypothetical protein
LSISKWSPWGFTSSSVAPDRFDRAILIKRAGTLAANTFVQLDGTVDGFDHFKQRDVSGVAGKRYAAARTT